MPSGFRPGVVADPGDRDDGMHGFAVEHCGGPRRHAATGGFSSA